MFSFVENAGGYGPRQFAFRRRHSAQDVLAFICALWILALWRKIKIGVYGSDIKGAFDRVDYHLMINKCKVAGLHGRAIAFLEALLSKRQAVVVVNGEKSDPMVLENTVLQGSVTGPSLWNLFFADVHFAVADQDFFEIIFADDLNSFKCFAADVSNQAIKDQLSNCQLEVHAWGKLNRVEFEASKEFFAILHRSQGEGNVFKILGVQFDHGLYMSHCIRKIKRECGW
jgi:Reverse transcriptase (RNA-dependent DNA polymerase).